MKFKVGDILYYVNPFIFVIDKVQIEFTDYDNGQLFYIDAVGAYLAEHDLFERLEDAKGHAMTRLQDFYDRKQNEIWKTNPKLDPKG